MNIGSEKDGDCMKRLLALVFASLLCMSPVTFADASDFVENDGMIYYHGDFNYPIWSMGKRVGAVADLSSAYISDDDGKWRLVGFLSFPVVFRTKGGFQEAIPLEDELRECFFWQKVKTGDFFFYKDGRPGNKVEGQAFVRELTAYRMLMEAAETNMSYGEG